MLSSDACNAAPSGPLSKWEATLQALQARLAEVDEQIQEQLQKITSAKANISRNDSRINQLLRMVVSV